MFKTIKVESNLELPYNLIDIQDGEKRFIFLFKCFDDNQTEYSIQAGGVTGKFEVTYKCCGIDSNFECDITIGNLYYFYIELGIVMLMAVLRMRLTDITAELFLNFR